MNQKHVQMKSYLFAILLVIIGVFFDQYTKHLAVLHLKNQNPFVIIDGVFELHYLENHGAAFGLLQNQKLFFLISTTIFLIVAAWVFSRIVQIKKFIPLTICIIFLVSGAIGNMIDRIRFSYVVDFFYFKLIDFPIFNVADIYVTVSMIVLILLIFFYYKEEDLDKVFHR